MRTCTLPFGVVVGLGLLLGGCNQAPPDGARYGQASATIASGMSPTDTGILQDPADYQPARPPEGSSGVEAGAAPRASRGGSTAAGRPRGGDTASEVALAVTDLANLIRDGEVAQVLRMFPDEQVAVLGDDEIDMLYVTSEKLDRVARALEAKVDAAQAGPLLDKLRGFAAPPEWEIHDAAHATVKPNVAALFVGPGRAGETIKLSKADGAWAFELDASLSSTDVAELAGFHQNMQTALDQVVAWLAATEKPALDVLAAAIDKIWAGEAIELPAGGVEETPKEGEEESRSSGGRRSRTAPRSP